MRPVLSMIGWMAMLAGAGLWAQPPKLPPRDEVIRHLPFRLQLNDIEPRTATVEEGWWMIRLQNGVTTTELDVQLDDQNGVRVANKRTVALSGKTAMLVNLRPGRHVLKIPGNANWQAEIQVRPKAR